MWKLENLAIKKNSILIFQLKFACRNLDIALSLNCPKKIPYAKAVSSGRSPKCISKFVRTGSLLLKI